MQRSITFLSAYRHIKNALLLCFGMLLLNLTMPGYAAEAKAGIDTNLQATIQSQLSLAQHQLYYPASAHRFYKNAALKLVWIAPDTVKTHASEAMMMLDCVLHYGLNHTDYHPAELLYDRLNSLIRSGNKAKESDKAKFDIFLTDAMLTFINHLHYGKLNPDEPSGKTDTSITSSFRAELVLQKALRSTDFWSVIESVQPKDKQYAYLQDYMRLVTGQYVGDCYEMPDSTIRLMTINLERLRWANSSTSSYLQINVPSYTLTLHQPDTVYTFKVIVGKLLTPTPRLQSNVTHFTTAPEWKVPHNIFVRELLPKALRDKDYLENNHIALYDNQGHYQTSAIAKLKEIQKKPALYYARQSSGCDNAMGAVVFRFDNVYDVYLHDTPQQDLFKRRERALSHGCIRVEQASKLAALLLKYDGATNQVVKMQNAVTGYHKQTFRLRAAVPIKITYITCEIVEGIITTYKDIYQLDKQLETALYFNSRPVLTLYPVRK
jgi:murein L,D-transpeptidase YcbB/YkuD